MHREEVPGLPGGVGRTQEANAGVHRAPHLVGVDDGVNGPHVVGVRGHGREAEIERLVVLTGFLQPERRHAPHESGVRMVAERRQRAARAVAQLVGGTDEEVELVHEHERQQIGRPLDQHVVQRGRSAVPIARQPRPDRPGVALLPIVRVRRHQRRVGIGGRGEIVDVGAHQVEVRPRGARHRCRVGRFDERHRLGHEIGMEPHHPVEQFVVGGDGVAVTAHRVAVRIEHGPFSLLALRWAV